MRLEHLISIPILSVVFTSTSPEELAASSRPFGGRLAAVSLPKIGELDKAMRRPCNMQQRLGFAKTVRKQWKIP